MSSLRFQTAPRSFHKAPVSWLLSLRSSGLVEPMSTLADQTKYMLCDSNILTMTSKYRPTGANGVSCLCGYIASSSAWQVLC